MIDRNGFGSLRKTWKETHRVCPVLGIMELWNKDKADILSRQSGSVYTRENAGDIPLKEPSPFPDIEDISIDPNRVRTLLDRLNPNKASGPDDLSAQGWKNAVLKLLWSWPASSTNPLSKQLYQTTGVIYRRAEIFFLPQDSCNLEWTQPKLSLQRQLMGLSPKYNDLGFGQGHKQTFKILEISFSQPFPLHDWQSMLTKYM